MTTSGYMPDVKVEIAFASGFSTAIASRTWVDVSDYVEASAGIGTGLGRGDEFSIADANSLTVTLDNSDGRFTPEKASGAYYPNVKIGRPIRVTAKRVGAGAAVDRFNGYIDAWNLSSSGANAVATISATSQIARFGMQTALEGEGTIPEIFAGLEGIYALCETASPASDSRDRLPDLVEYIDGVTFLSPVQWAAGLGVDGPGTAVRLNDAALVYNFPAVAGATRYSTGLLVNDECVIEFFAAPAAGASLQVEVKGKCIHPTYGLGDQLVLVALSDAPSISSVSVIDSTWAGGAMAQGYGPTFDGSLHHFAARINSAGAEFWIDGARVGTSPSSDTAPFTDIEYIALRNAPAVDVDVSYFAISNDATTIAARALLGLSNQDGQTASDRIALCASAAGAQTLDVDVTTDVLDPYLIVGKTLIDALRAAETTDGGVLFDGPGGVLNYRSRSARYNTASAFTLDASLQQVEASVAPRLDRATLTNEVTVTRSDYDEFGRAADADSIEAYGVVRSSFEIQADAGACAEAAAWAIFLHGEPGVRIPNLEIDLLALDAAKQDAVLAAEVGTHFTVSGLPAEFPTSSLDFFIEGYTEAIGLETYRIALNVSPCDPAKFNVWILEDATFGAYDSNPLAY